MFGQGEHSQNKSIKRSVAAAAGRGGKKADPKKTAGKEERGDTG